MSINNGMMDGLAPQDTFLSTASLTAQIGVVNTAVQSLERDMRKWYMDRDREDVAMAFFLSRVQLIESAIGSLNTHEISRTEAYHG